MGEYADLMLEGCLCQSCGELLGEGDGFPEYCSACQSEMGVDRAGQLKPIKIQCPYCKKKVKDAGLAMHIRDVHKNIAPHKPYS
jgi:hypothetical protein